MIGLIAQTYIQAPYDKIWSYLTEPQYFDSWYSAPGLEFGQSIGAPVAWGTPETPVIRGELLALEPGLGFRHTFRFEFLDSDEESTVTWDVVQRGPVCWLRVRHDCAVAPQTHQVVTNTGWVKSLARLKTLLETGRPMPWPEEELT